MSDNTATNGEPAADDATANDERAADDATANDKRAADDATANDKRAAKPAADDATSENGPSVAETTRPTTVRVRGIYTTAVTRLLLAAGHDVVRASPPIRRRFDQSFPVTSEAVRVETTANRLGLGIHGEPDAVERLESRLAAVARDSLSYRAAAPVGAVYEGQVKTTRGGDAVVALTDSTDGTLPFDAADGYVETDDTVRVQIKEPHPPWTDDRPELDTRLRTTGGLATLVRGRDEPRVAGGDRAASRELAGMTELLNPDLPDGWGIEWARDATAASLDALEDALDRASDRARGIEAALEPDESVSDSDHTDTARALTTPFASAWVWFGRESRGALDDHRRAVTTTMPGHHRIKAGSRQASAGVDFAEAVASFDSDAPFPFTAVTDQFGPTTGDRVEIAHGKPDGRRFSLGRARVTNREPDGRVTLERELESAGTYDGLETRRDPGDTATTKIKEGRWWYPTSYEGADGTNKGTYVNVCTPVELFPDAVSYVDLHVDVVRRPDSTVERVDDDELDAAVEAGHVSSALAERARNVASAVVRALSG